MLQITIPPVEEWDELNEEFVYKKGQVLQLEHSLVSISKWESKWCKTYLSKQKKTKEESLDYIRCMTLTQNVDPDIYNYLTVDNLKQINNYIEAKMSATNTSSTKGTKTNNEAITSEYIYYMMVALNIPFECQKWHLQRLFALIHICNIKNQPPKKGSRKDILSGYAALNAARRKQLNTKG